MKFENGLMELDSKDCQEILEELKKICDINKDTDLLEDVPILIGFNTWCKKQNINFTDIRQLSYDIDDMLLGTAILTHYRWYIEFINNEENRMED